MPFHRWPTFVKGVDLSGGEYVMVSDAKLAAIS